MISHIRIDCPNPLRPCKLSLAMETVTVIDNKYVAVTQITLLTTTLTLKGFIRMARSPMVIFSINILS